MNEIVKEMISRLTGLPESAVVAHALLEYDLGVDQIKMEKLMSGLDHALSLQTERHVWSAFKRVGDLHNYVTHQLKHKDLHFSTNLNLEPRHDN